MTGTTRTISLPDLDAPEPSVSTFELRRFLAGELSPERRAQIEADPSLQERLAKLAAEQKADDAAFALEMPLPRFLADHEKRTAKPQGLFAKLLSLRFTVGATAFAAAAAAVLFVVVNPEDPIRMKGDARVARVAFMVREADGVRFGVEGERLKEGDQIQFAVKDDAKNGAMVLVGVDGRGAVTVYAAERVDRERAKGVAGEQVKPRILSDSVVLDDATGAERFFVVYADTDVDALRREVEAAARRVGAEKVVSTTKLDLPSSYEQDSVHIVKVR